MAGIYSDFINYRVPEASEIESALSQASVTIDANVLLDLYRGSDAYTSNMMVAMNWLGDRLFVTHQAMREFWRNRTAVLEDRTKAKGDFEKSLGGASQAMRQAINHWASRTQASELELSRLSALLESFTSGVEEVILSAHGDDTENYPAPSEDPILQELEGLLEGKVCERVPDDQWKERVEEGIRRHSLQIAPGFKEKVPDKEHLPENVSGDYLVWAQSCDVAKARDQSLIIITRDQKEDWWWRVKSAFLGPNRDLIEEFNSLVQHQIYLMTPQDFLRHFAVINQTELPPDAFDSGSPDDDKLEEEVEATDKLVEVAPPELGVWTPRALHAVMKRLRAESPNQAAVIEAAIADGGSVDRATVYRICGFEPTRMLRGFTKPVTRHMRAVRRSGLLPAGAPELLRPTYEEGPQANRWVVPTEVVELARSIGGSL